MCNSAYLKNSSIFSLLVTKIEYLLCFFFPDLLGLTNVTRPDCGDAGITQSSSTRVVPGRCNCGFVNVGNERRFDKMLVAFTTYILVEEP